MSKTPLQLYLHDVALAQTLFETLNNTHQAINFTMELSMSGTLPFLGMNLSKKGCKIVTSAFVKSGGCSPEFWVGVCHWIVTT